jgi:hypothetical protein
MQIRVTVTLSLFGLCAAPFLGGDRHPGQAFGRQATRRMSDITQKQEMYGKVDRE